MAKRARRHGASNRAVRGTRVRTQRSGHHANRHRGMAVTPRNPTQTKVQAQNPVPEGLDPHYLPPPIRRGRLGGTPMPSRDQSHRRCFNHQEKGRSRRIRPRRAQIQPADRAHRQSWMEEGGKGVQVQMRSNFEAPPRAAASACQSGFACITYNI